MGVSKVLEKGMVNFVCPRCQRIYYQHDMDEFNDDPKKVAKDAKVYKGHYHSCRKVKSNKKKAGNKANTNRRRN